jgi:hypothetical protein
MSIREQLMDIPCPPNKLGYHKALKRAADIAEAKGGAA